MKTYVQPGNTITLAAPAAVTSGSGVLVGAIFGIAAHDAASGDPLETVTDGVFDLNKIGSQAWASTPKTSFAPSNRFLQTISPCWAVSMGRCGLTEVYPWTSLTSIVAT